MLAKGLISGLVFIHKSEFASHGRLSSQVCFIDDHYNIKIAGFGLQALGAYSQVSDEERVFVAPEHLANYPNIGAGTTSGDVYSLGMLLCMIFTHKAPFEDSQNKNSVLQNVASDSTSQTRPGIGKDTPPEIANASFC